MDQQQAPDLREHFQRKSFPGMEVTQSPFIKINENSYSVVGQHIIRNSPLFTYYDVFDQDGNPASVDTAEKIYSYIAMTELTTFMSDIKSQLLKPLEKSHKSKEIEDIDEDLSEQIRLKYKLKYKIDITELEQENTRILHLFEKVESANQSLQEMNYWTENDLRKFLRAWEAFWIVYQGRMSQLLKFYEFCKGAKIIQKVVVGTQLDRIFREAKAMYDVFTKSIPEDTAFMEDVHDFIILMAQLGHEPYNSSNGKAFRPVGRALDYILQITYKTMLWVLIPIVALLFLLNIVSLYSLGLTVLITFGCYVADLLVRSYLESAAQKHLKKQRANSISRQPMIQTKYKEVYAALQRLRKIEEKKPEVYNFPAVHSDSGYGLILFGLIIIAFGFIVKVATDGQYLIHYTIIGSVFALIGVILIIYFRGTVYLGPNKLTFKRMKINPVNISVIWINRSGSKISIEMLPRQPYIIKVPRGYREQAKSFMIKWCSENDVPHLEDRRMQDFLKGVAIALAAIVFIFILSFFIMNII